MIPLPENLYIPRYELLQLCLLIASTREHGVNDISFWVTWDYLMSGAEINYVIESTILCH